MSESTAEKSIYYIGRLRPAIGALPISQLTAPELLTALRRIEAKGNYETAQRVLQLSGRAFRYAVSTARLASDPSRDLRGALTAPVATHYGAIVEAWAAGQLLRAIDGYDGYATTSWRCSCRRMCLFDPASSVMRSGPRSTLTPRCGSFHLKR